MSDTAIATLIEAIEAQSGVCRQLLEAFRESGRRDIELADNIIDLERRLAFTANRARLLLNMKACTLTTRCLRCNAMFATEPGPELCGPCWTELGRPERYLTPVPPIGA